MSLNAKDGHADYFAIVRRYADTMLDQNKGRDHFGPQSSPLFATVLDRRSYEIPSRKVEDLVRARVTQENKTVANPHDPAMLTDIEAVVDFIAERDPTTGAISHCSSSGNWLRPESTVSLAISLWDSIPLVPDKLGAKMRGLAESIDDVLLKLPHDPGPRGKDWC